MTHFFCVIETFTCLTKVSPHKIQISVWCHCYTLESAKQLLAAASNLQSIDAMIAWQYLQLALFGLILSWCKNGYVNAQNELASPKTSAGTPKDSSPLFLKPKSEIESSPKGDAAHQTLPCPGDGMVEIMDFSDPKYHVDAASSFALQEILQGNSPYDTDAFGVSIDSSEKVQLIIWSALAGTAIDKGTDLDLTLEILVKGSCTGAFRVVVHDREGQFTAQTWGDQIIPCEQLTYAPTSAPTASTTKHPPVIEPGTNIARAPVTKVGRIP